MSARGERNKIGDQGLALRSRALLFGQCNG